MTPALRFFTFWIIAASRGSAAWTPLAPEDLPSPGHGIVFQKGTARADREVSFHSVRFNDQKCRLRVIDHPPESSGNLGSAMQAVTALAGVNGGYFHPDRSPLGLVISGGKKLHGFEKAKLLSGIVAVRQGKVTVLRAAEYKAETKYEEALQAGPFLVDGGKPAGGLNNARRAARTVVAVDRKGNCVLLVSSAATLAEVAELLTTPGILGDFKVARALNLDGGSSSALWVNGAAPRYLREFKEVRNYLAVLPRDAPLE